MESVTQLLESFVAVSLMLLLPPREHDLRGISWAAKVTGRLDVVQKTSSVDDFAGSQKSTDVPSLAVAYGCAGPAAQGVPVLSIVTIINVDELL